MSDGANTAPGRAPDPITISEFFYRIAALTRCTLPDPTFSSRGLEDAFAGGQ
jgi:hypothetical protein